MEEQTQQVDIQQQNLSLIEKSLSIQKDRQEQKVRKNEIFKIAIENAEQIALNSLCFPENELIKYLNNAEETLGIRRIQWHLILRDEKDFIILKEDIETPTRWNRNSQKEENIKFRFSRFFKKESFIKKCKDYYKQYNCNISVTRTKGPRWEIIIEYED
tara:strand:- start:900 stop:1376 length:477 start_codon:yes stop_codon:yes gene_type:complete